MTYFELFLFAQWSDFASKRICSPFLIQYYTANSSYYILGWLYQRSAIWHIYSEENLNLASHASILTFFLLYVSLKAAGFIELQG